MAEVTIMELEVDLECHKCYRKIKKLLCKYPEIRDQTYKEKEDKVIITVVCCSPERIRQKLICKAHGNIKSIKIQESKPEPKADGPKEIDKKPKSTTVIGYPPMYPIGVCCKQCFGGRWGGPCHCHHGYGIPNLQPPSSYDGYVRLTPSYDGWPSGCRCDRSYGCRCEFYTENYPPCTIM